MFDAGRRAFPIFQKANSIGAVNWVSMDPPLRETMLVRGDVDPITSCYFTSLLNLEAVWNASFLPTAAERDIFALVKPAKN